MLILKMTRPIKARSLQQFHFTASYKRIFIPESYLEVNHSRSSGPGGQNVNKVNTKVELRFNIEEADWLPEDLKERLKIQRSTNMNKNGDFIVTS